MEFFQLVLQLWSINTQQKPVLPEHLEPLGTWKAEAFIWTQVHISTLNVACVQLHSLKYLFCYSIPMLVNLL